MKHVSKRLVSMLLVLCMVLSVLPLSVFAAPGQTLKVAFRYRIVPAGGGSWSGEAGRSEEYAVQVDADGAFELALPAGFEEVFPNAEFRGRLLTKLFDGWTGVGPTVAYDADIKTARVTGCTDVLDETKTYLIDVVYNEQFYKVSFGDDIRENLTWNDIVKIPAVPASGDVNRWGLGWTANGRQYLPGGEARVSELFAGIPRGTTELELEPAYLDLTDRHIVLWTDGLSGEVYRVDTVADGETVPTPPDVGRLGYTFDGWDGDTAAPVTENLVLRAQWAANEIPVTYIKEHCTAAGPDHALVGGMLSFSADADEGYAPTLAGYSVMLGDEVLSVGYAALLSVSGQKAVYQMTVPAGDALQIRILTDETPMSYELSFYADDDLVEQKRVEKGGFVLAPVIPDKAGYNALYWTDGTENVEVGEKIENVTADARWYAVYEEATYTVSFYDADYELIDSSEVTFGQYFPVPEYTGRVPEGKTFLCWQGDDGQMLLPEFNGLMSYTHDLTFNPVFSDNTEYCLVKFMVGGELHDAKLYERVSGQTLTLPAEPTKPGYTFVGWFGEGDEPVTDDTPVPLDGATYHAEFTVNTYNLTYYRGAEADTSEFKCILMLPDGSFVEFFNNDTTDMPTYVLPDVTFGDTVVLAEPMLPGYVFKGWVDGSGYLHPAGAQYTMPAHDVLLTAVWEVDQALSCMVRFVSDGQLYSAYLAFDGQTAEIPAIDPTASGKVFLGWQYGDSLYSNDGVKDFTVKANEAREMTLEAVWASDSYSVTYRSEGMDDETVSDLHYGELHVLHDAPERAGYLFGGWEELETGAVYNARQAVSITCDMLLRAIWTEVPAGKTAVKFVNNGDLYDIILVDKGSNGVAPETAPTRPGYTFVEWRCDALNSFVRAGEPFGVAADADDLIVYTAVYTRNSYKLHFNLDGGRPDYADIIDVGYGETVALADVAEKDGYVFIGWREDATGIIYGAMASYVVRGDADFTAVWEAASCVVRFLDAETGILYGYEPVSEGQQVAAPGAPTVSGKTFLYWVNQDKEADKVMAGALTPNIFKDTVYLAAYEVSTHNIAVAAENCAVTGVPTERVAVGTEIRFAVEANEGYRLGTVGLVYTDGLSTVVRELKPNADGLYTFRMPDADVTIVAKAEKSRFSIFAAPAEHSRIDAPNYANAGESVPVVVSVDPGYVLHAVLGLTGNDQMIPLTLVLQEDGSCGYLFTMPAADVTLQTVTVKAAHTVTFLDADNTLLAIVPVDHDELLDAALVPQVEKTGYEFSGWEYLPVNGKTFDPANDAVAKSLIVRATYEGLPFTVEAGHVDNIKYLKASSGANSSDLLEGDKLTAKAGADVLVRFAAERDWAITGIAIVGLDGSKTIVEPILRTKESKDGVNYYEFGFTMPTEHVKIDLYTVAKLYRVDVVENLPEAGDYTINGHHSNNLYVPQGNDVVIDIMPVPGYYVAEVTACFNDGISLKSVPDGTLSEDGTRYTFPMVGYDVTVTITYAPHDYNIDIETSNALTYRPDQAADPDQIIESLDPSYTTKGWIEFVGERNVWKDATNELNQQYKYLANGAAVVGERVAFRVVEWTGYHLAELTVTCDDGEVTVPVTLKDGIYYFDMPADHVVITAIFAENTYTVFKDAASEAHGTVELNGLRENRISADYKQEVTVTVTPDDGYQVTRIYYVLANGDVLDFDAAAYENADVMTDAHDTVHAITFHMPASDVTVYAEYAPILYTISDDCAEASVEYTTPHTVGEKVVFTTKANYGYIITEVYVLDENRERVNLHTDTVNALYGGRYYFDMPASPVTIYVETMKDEFNVVYLANGKLVDYEDVDYLATANVAARVPMVSDAPVGYHFVGWTSADVQTPVTAAAPSVSNADFVIVKERTYIVAAYAKDEIDVHFLATANGTVTEKFTGADNAAEYRLDTTVFGDVVQFTAVPDTGYEIDAVRVFTATGDGHDLDVKYTVSDTAYTFLIPATYKPDVHTVQAADVIVAVTFRKACYTLTKAADCETDGMISVNGSVATETSFEYRFLDPVTITATPKDGYYVASIVAQSADGSEKFEITGTKPAVDTIRGDALTLSFLMPACGLTYTVDYEKCDFSVTTVYDAEHGTVTTAPANIAQLDDIVTVTVEPKPGYRLASLTATYAGGEKSLVLTEIAENRYTFTMPAAAVTVTALFEEVNYTVTLTVDGEATTALNGFDTVNIGVDYLDTVTVSVTPAAGWELTAITVDGGKITVNEEIKRSGGDYTFTMPEHDVAVEVKLTKTGYGLKAYAINSFESGHGKVTLSPERVAYVGDLVTITADPDDGYRVGRVIVLDVNGKTVPVNYVKNDYDYIETWSFTMPASNVAITVKFEVQGSSYYDDVRTDAWYYNAVTFVTDRGYFNGVSEMLFAPYIDMNRAMFVTVLGRMANVDTSKYMGLAFSDLEAGMYYVPYVKWANENGIVLGRSDTIFDPDASITREEMAAIMYRYCAYIGMDMTPKNTVFMERYTDRNEISDWAVTYVEWAVGCGLMRGMTDHTIDPLEHASRAQVAQVIMNFCDKVLYR